MQLRIECKGININELINKLDKIHLIHDLNERFDIIHLNQNESGKKLVQSS